MSETVLREYARAKVNLTLHVGRVISDPHDPFFGYHPLDSLVVFAAIGDRIEIMPDPELRLTVSGPYSAPLQAETQDDNLIMRAYRAVEREVSLPNFHISLTKTLPVASGVGGGSANAAAMLRLLRPYADLPDTVWHKLALSLGADVPVCLGSRTARMTGIGDTLTHLDDVQLTPAVLVNPGVSVSTREIFKAFDRRDDLKHMPQPQSAQPDIWARALAGGNDLQEIAIDLVPGIARVLNTLEQQAGCEWARMSGSGATCFGIFKSDAAAQRAARAIQVLRPDWWCRSTHFGDDAQLQSPDILS